MELALTMQLQTTQVLFIQRIKASLFSGFHGVNSFVYTRHWANRSLTVDEAFILPRSGFVQQNVQVRSAITPLNLGLVFSLFISKCGEINYGPETIIQVV